MEGLFVRTSLDGEFWAISLMVEERRGVLQDDFHFATYATQPYEVKVTPKLLIQW